MTRRTIPPTSPPTTPPVTTAGTTRAAHVRQHVRRHLRQRRRRLRPRRHLADGGLASTGSQIALFSGIGAVVLTAAGIAFVRFGRRNGLLTFGDPRP